MMILSIRRKNRHMKKRQNLIALTKLMIRKIKRPVVSREGYDLCRTSDLFDSEWYISQYPDVKASGLDPLAHFLLYGGIEGRDPSEKFSSQWYINTYPDVKKSGINPLVHYLLYGKNEGRKPK